MNETKLTNSHPGLHWSEIEAIIQRGKAQRAEALANWTSAGWKSLLRLVRSRPGTDSPEDQAARRLRLQEFVADPSKGFFWPRLSWIAHEGLRLIPAEERESDGLPAPEVRPRLAAGDTPPKVNPHRVIGG